MENPEQIRDEFGTETGDARVQFPNDVAAETTRKWASMLPTWIVELKVAIADREQAT